MARKPAAQRHIEVYNYIQKCTKEKGYPPSVREICAAIGVSSPSTVHAYLTALEEKGLIARESGKTRAIHIPENDCTFEWKPVPIVGRVRAGVPAPAIEDIEGYVPYSGKRTAGECFALRVKGDSMVNAGIFEGDVLVFRKQNTAEHGEIVVALIGEEATVKRFYMQDGEILLKPENDAYEPIDAKGAVILGKAVELYREM